MHGRRRKVSPRYAILKGEKFEIKFLDIEMHLGMVIQ